MNIRCVDCSTPYKAIEDERESRVPCPQCGSVGRALTKVVDEAISIEDTRRGTLRGKKVWSKKSGRKRPYREVDFGHENSRDGGRLIDKHREIDRSKDWYHERIIDAETGEVQHEEKGKLSDHTGHGSDRARRSEEDV